MNKIKLVEGTHYRRRFNQPSPSTRKSRELVSCLFCDTSSYLDDEAHRVERVGRNKRCKGVVRLDKLVKHKFVKQNCGKKNDEADSTSNVRDLAEVRCRKGNKRELLYGSV